MLVVWDGANARGGEECEGEYHKPCVSRDMEDVSQFLLGIPDRGLRDHQNKILTIAAMVPVEHNGEAANHVTT
jgi:hypothetical protein